LSNILKEPALLAALNKETKDSFAAHAKWSFQGRVLSMLSKLIRPLTILEIGTYTGYSALCLCEGMQENGVLHTIDIRKNSIFNENILTNLHGNQIMHI
jgi:predicted O-methyltransferase YrrM